eukprot:scaffold56586_cov54-Phaeocystis_antarctica.AAC.1
MRHLRARVEVQVLDKAIERLRAQVLLDHLVGPVGAPSGAPTRGRTTLQELRWQPGRGGGLGAAADSHLSQRRPVRCRGRGGDARRRPAVITHVTVRVGTMPRRRRRPRPDRAAACRPPRARRRRKLVDAAAATTTLGATRARGARGTLLRKPTLDVDLASALAEHWREQLH